MASTTSPRADTFPQKLMPRKRTVPGILFKPSFRFNNRRRQLSNSAPLDPLSVATLPSTSTPSPIDASAVPQFPWPFGKPCTPPTSRRGRDLGSAASSLRTCRYRYDSAAPCSSLPKLEDVGWDMHPGTLVDFSVTLPSREAEHEEEVEEADEEYAGVETAEDSDVDVEIEIGTWTAMPITASPARSISIEPRRQFHSHTHTYSKPSPYLWKSCHPPPPPLPTSSPPPPSQGVLNTEMTARRLPNVDYKAAKLHRRTRSEELRERSRRESCVTRLHSTSHTHSHSHSHSKSQSSTSTINTNDTANTRISARQGSWESVASSRSSVDADGDVDVDGDPVTFLEADVKHLSIYF
jgi:hypothetical protein